MVRIFLDPGHGGNDPGAVGNGLQEKDLVLDIGLRVRDLLEEYAGVEVEMSRTTDVFVDLSQRATLANNWGADYFVSIHINAGGGTGFESFIHSAPSQDEVNFQPLIHNAIMSQISVSDRGQKSQNFAVLRETSMPAILTENLFIDNSSDAALLSDSSFLQSVAVGHANGIADIFDLEDGGGGEPPSSTYRVIVDGTQEGAYGDTDNITNSVSSALGTAGEITVQRVGSSNNYQYPSPGSGDVYQVYVDGSAEGAYGEHQNVLNALTTALNANADEIHIVRV
ncbi:N-acetylmuramoyl-L-alanine amidase [Geomicrobium sp. JCM 19039]|uniref:N-acetylmuramoyl-L-alanine amidase family protein n=1 Tax=Geomicrobium sp. JCM 19039 TaxID=1460636 RepID=UPI00045F25A2|nr:N-acetylmuramoyl-L-alanine amidase [Geomicrobium sp. JCM 19039]GAK10617.1 N-acetylmuramoyl-L-alanine amidase [Geomicrobium sp. JCM 19039]